MPEKKFPGDLSIRQQYVLLYSKKEMNMVRRYYFIPLLLTVLLEGCAHEIRIDSGTYLHNPALYKHKDVIITADLPQVLDNYEALRGATIETSARIAHFEERDSASWYLILEKEGKELRAYEDTFLKFVPADAVYLARWAKNEGGNVTARGKLLDGRMELDQLAYKTLIVNTSAIPT
jgi:hypothetical protein